MRIILHLDGFRRMLLSTAYWWILSKSDCRQEDWTRRSVSDRVISSTYFQRLQPNWVERPKSLIINKKRIGPSIMLILHHLPLFAFNDFNIPSFTLIYSHLASFTFIYLHVLSFTFIYLDLRSSTFVYLHLPSFTLIYTFLYLHLCLFTFIYVHLPSFTFI